MPFPSVYPRIIWQIAASLQVVLSNSVGYVSIQIIYLFVYIWLDYRPRVYGKRGVSYATGLDCDDSLSIQ